MSKNLFALKILINIVKLNLWNSLLLYCIITLMYVRKFTSSYPNIQLLSIWWIKIIYPNILSVKYLVNFDEWLADKHACNMLLIVSFTRFIQSIHLNMNDFVMFFSMPPIARPMIGMNKIFDGYIFSVKWIVVKR